MIPIEAIAAAQETCAQASAWRVTASQSHILRVADIMSLYPLLPSDTVAPALRVVIYFSVKHTGLTDSR